MNAQYGSYSRIAAVQDALRAAGFGEGPIPWEALAQLDQFHVGGLAATRQLALRLAIVPRSRVLDVGSGLGGPSRFLAATYGCDVTGIDLTAPFVEIAEMLTQRTGLGDRVRSVVGDATDLPFDDVYFDIAWTQHVAMNIADRAGLYAGVYRVLVPGGRFAMYDVISGDSGPIEYPVPWASDVSVSYVTSAAEMRGALETAGFAIEVWEDTTQLALAWFAAPAPADAGHGAALALPIVAGADFPARAGNLARNIREGPRASRASCRDQTRIAATFGERDDAQAQ